MALSKRRKIPNNISHHEFKKRSIKENIRIKISEIEIEKQYRRSINKVY